MASELFAHFNTDNSGLFKGIAPSKVQLHQVHCTFPLSDNCICLFSILDAYCSTLTPSVNIQC